VSKPPDAVTVEDIPANCLCATRRAIVEVVSPLSKLRVADQLHEVGVKAGDVLVVHASYRAVGPIEGGPSGLIQVLLGILGATGTLVMPAMSASQRTDPFDPSKSETWQMGILAEMFWQTPGLLRSSHPTSSFAAHGPQAAEINAP
jgi:aminoglycoside 3-N-acetyltransferase